MPRVRLFHWNAREAKPLIKQLRAEGYVVDYPSDRGYERPYRSLRESPPHAIVIDLTRLPAQGRHVAVALRAQETIKNIPIVFVDGVAEKVEKIRAELPDAIYTSRAKVGPALKRAKPLANPAAPPASNRTAAQKLGIREGMRVAVVDGPRDYAKVVGALPEGASFEEDPAEVLPVTLWFVREPDVYLAGLPDMRGLAAKSRVWVIYPKQQAREKTPRKVTMFFIHDEAVAVGLAHYKTCSVDATWSGMAFALRK
jgi:CheY-like chemotaxis protein